MNFNAKTLNSNALLSRARGEAEQIYAKPSTRGGRTLNKIVETCLYGQAAEQYLLEIHAFKDDNRPYKDLFDHDDNSVEIKVTEGDYYVPYVLKRANESRSQPWRNFSDILYVFIGDKVSTEYSLYGIYEWNGKQFGLQK
jgi:hypothetical protein